MLLTVFWKKPCSLTIFLIRWVPVFMLFAKEGVSTENINNKRRIKLSFIV